jgi:hypothetical protein
MSEPSNRRLEPEIIPPGAPLPRDRGVWATNDTHRTHYVYTSRGGPVSFALLMVGVGAAAVLGLLFLLSAAFVGLAAIGLVTVAAVVTGILRRFNQPLR